jgi:glycosyl transferase family 87
MTREQKINTVSLIVLVGFTLAVFYYYVVGTDLHLAYPYNTFLSQPEDQWMDFLWPYVLSANPYIIPRPSHQNFPFLYRVAAAFKIIGPVAGLFTFLFLFWAFFAYICLRELRTSDRIANLQTAFIFCFLAFPVIISLDRANFEVLEFVFLYLYIFYYTKHPNLSTFALGCGIALKGFPVILAVLLIADKRPRQLLIAALTSITLTVVSYATLPGGIIQNIVMHLVNLKLYNQLYGIDNHGLYLGNSIWGGLKFLAIWTHSQVIAPTAYTILSVVVLALLSGYIVLIEKSFWKRTALAVCALNLLPMVSGDYKLLHLFIPLFLFVNANEKSKFDWIYVILFGLLLIPKNYYHLPTLPEADIAILLDPLLMISLVLLVILGNTKDKVGLPTDQLIDIKP